MPPKAPKGKGRTKPLSPSPSAACAGPAAAALWIFGIGSDVPLPWSPFPRRGAGLGPGWRVLIRPPERKKRKRCSARGPQWISSPKILFKCGVDSLYRGHPETRACPATGLHLHTKPPIVALVLQVRDRPPRHYGYWVLGRMSLSLGPPLPVEALVLGPVGACRCARQAPKHPRPDRTLGGRCASGAPPRRGPHVPAATLRAAPGAWRRHLL